MRILAIDYGSKKVGLAMSDETESIALPFLILKNKGDEIVACEIKKICKENEIGKIIIGIPKTLSGKESEQTQQVKRFVDFLKKEIKLSIILRDERLTSKMAQRFLEKNKKYDDKIAAQILLQGYLDKS